MAAKASIASIHTSNYLEPIFVDTIAKILGYCIDLTDQLDNIRYSFANLIARQEDENDMFQETISIIEDNPPETGIIEIVEETAVVNKIIFVTADPDENGENEELRTFISGETVVGVVKNTAVTGDTSVVEGTDAIDETGEIEDNNNITI